MGKPMPKAFAAMIAAKKNRAGKGKKGEDKKESKAHEAGESSDEAKAEQESEGHKELMGSMARKMKKK